MPRNPRAKAFEDHAVRLSTTNPLSLQEAAVLPRWLSLEQVRKMQRMRRQTVIAAMMSGELPFEQRGHIRYIRLSEVIVWEERRMRRHAEPTRLPIHPDLVRFL